MFGPKWSPRIPGVNIKVPFWGENMEKCFVNDFCDFYKTKLKNGTEMITSCSTRRVGLAASETGWIGASVYGE